MLNKKLAVSVKSNVDHLNPGTTFKKNNIDYITTYNENKKLFLDKIMRLGIKLNFDDQKILEING